MAQKTQHWRDPTPSDHKLPDGDEDMVQKPLGRKWDYVSARYAIYLSVCVVFLYIGYIGIKHIVFDDDSRFSLGKILKLEEERKYIRDYCASRDAEIRAELNELRQELRKFKIGAGIKSQNRDQQIDGDQAN